jgi:hypothetical protein
VALSWTLNSNFIKNDYWMWIDGTLVWHDTGVIGWDRDKKAFASFLFGMDGTIGGSLKITTEAKTLVLEGKTNSRSPYARYRTKMSHVDAQTMSVQTWSLDKDGKASVISDRKYKKVKETEKEKKATKKVSAPAKEK